MLVLLNYIQIQFMIVANAQMVQHGTVQQKNVLVEPVVLLGMEYQLVYVLVELIGIIKDHVLVKMEQHIQTQNVHVQMAQHGIQ
jgi:hypothetical protein